VDVAEAVAADIEGMLDLLAATAAEDRWIGTQVPFDRIPRSADYARRSARR